MRNDKCTINKEQTAVMNLCVIKFLFPISNCEEKELLVTICYLLILPWNAAW